MACLVPWGDVTPQATTNVSNSYCVRYEIMKFSVIYLFAYLGRYLEDSICHYCQLKIIIKEFFVGCSTTPGY